MGALLLGGPSVGACFDFSEWGPFYRILRYSFVKPHCEPHLVLIALQVQNRKCTRVTCNVYEGNADCRVMFF